MAFKCLLDNGYEDLVPPTSCAYGIYNGITECKQCDKYYRYISTEEQIAVAKSSIRGHERQEELRDMLKYCVEHTYDCDLSYWSIHDKKTILALCRTFGINRPSLGWDSDEVENGKET